MKDDGFLPWSKYKRTGRSSFATLIQNALNESDERTVKRPTSARTVFSSSNKKVKKRPNTAKTRKKVDIHRPKRPSSAVPLRKRPSNASKQKQKNKETNKERRTYNRPQNISQAKIITKVKDHEIFKNSGGRRIAFVKKQKVPETDVNTKKQKSFDSDILEGIARFQSEIKDMSQSITPQKYHQINIAVQDEIENKRKSRYEDSEEVRLKYSGIMMLKNIYLAREGKSPHHCSNGDFECHISLVPVDTCTRHPLGLHIRAYERKNVSSNPSAVNHNTTQIFWRYYNVPREAQLLFTVRDHMTKEHLGFGYFDVGEEMYGYDSREYSNTVQVPLRVPQNRNSRPFENKLQVHIYFRRDEHAKTTWCDDVLKRTNLLNNKSILYSLDWKAKGTIYDYVKKKNERVENQMSAEQSRMDDIRNLLPMWEKIFKSSDNGRANSITNKGIIEDEFTALLSSVSNISERASRILFRKMDADADGTLNWKEYVSFLIKQSQVTWQMECSKGTYWLDDRQNSEWLCSNSTGGKFSLFQKICVMPNNEQEYVTCTNDGIVQLWDRSFSPGLVFDPVSLEFGRNAHKLRSKQRGDQRSVSLMEAITDMAISAFGRQRNLITTHSSRKIRIFDISHGNSYKKQVDIRTAEFYCSINPECVCSFVSTANRPLMVVGGIHGEIETRCLMDIQNISSRNRHHDGAVKKVDYFPDLGILSSGMDGILSLLNPEYIESSSEDLYKHATVFGQDKHVNNRRRGIFDFCWCESHRFIASACYDGQVYLWDKHIMPRPIGILNDGHGTHGHSSEIIGVVANDSLNQVISVSSDRKIRVWDTRTLRVLQTITDTSQTDQLTSVAMDIERGCLLTAGNKIRLWPIKNAPGNRATRKNRNKNTLLFHSIKGKKSHKRYSRLKNINSIFESAARGQEIEDAELANKEKTFCGYSINFQQVVSIDMTGHCKVWDIHTGKRIFEFHTNHQSLITTMKLDRLGRRMATGAHDGTVKIWNINNGDCIYECVKRQQEITDLSFLSSLGPAWPLCGVGWDHPVVIWGTPDVSEKVDKEENTNYDSKFARHFKGHTADVLCITECSKSAASCFIATGSANSEVILWYLQSGEIKNRCILSSVTNLTKDEMLDIPEFLQEIDPSTSTVAVETLVYSATKEILFAGTDAGNIHAIDSNTGLELTNYSNSDQSVLFSSHNNAGISAIAIDPLCSKMTVGDFNGNLKFWDVWKVFKHDIEKNGQIKGELLNCTASKKVIKANGIVVKRNSPITSVLSVSDNSLNIVLSSAATQICLWTVNGSPLAVFGTEKEWPYWLREKASAAENRSSAKYAQVMQRRGSGRFSLGFESFTGRSNARPKKERVRKRATFLTNVKVDLSTTIKKEKEKEKEKNNVEQHSETTASHRTESLIMDPKIANFFKVESPYEPQTLGPEFMRNVVSIETYFRANQKKVDALLAAKKAKEEKEKKEEYRSVKRLMRRLERIKKKKEKKPAQIQLTRGTRSKSPRKTGRHASSKRTPSSKHSYGYSRSSRTFRESAEKNVKIPTLKLPKKLMEPDEITIEEPVTSVIKVSPRPEEFLIPFTTEYLE